MGKRLKDAGAGKHGGTGKDTRAGRDAGNAMLNAGEGIDLGLQDCNDLLPPCMLTKDKRREAVAAMLERFAWSSTKDSDLRKNVPVMTVILPARPEPKISEEPVNAAETSCM